MAYTFALVGNPNCGKTTMFNNITGSTQYVGNWPGVTVEKKEGRAKKFNENIKIVDLPGIYSLSPYTLEEVIARDYIVNETPNCVINIVDASNIERNLYLTLQLKELGIPVVLVLNMIDIVKARGEQINIEKLEKELGIPIVEASANKGKGTKEAVRKAVEISKRTVKNDTIIFDNYIENCIHEIREFIDKDNKITRNYNSRWLALKLIEDDEKIKEKIPITKEFNDKLNEFRRNIEKQYEDDAEGVIADQRYQYIANIIKKAVKKKLGDTLTLTDKIDRIVTNRILAIPIFLAIMWVIYYVSIQTLGDYTIGWVEGLVIDKFGGAVSNWLTVAGASEWLRSLIIDGIINGVGTVLTFVPQLMILFLFISLLEDSGYMARVAFVMDKFFRRFGLSGKSFIPMLIGSGCSVPGIMATRTLENDRDRKMTILLTPFISCGAKIPVYVLFASAFFPGKSGLVVFSLYILGIIIAIVSGIVLKKVIFKGEAAPFVMELPQYRVPTLKGLLIHMWDRAKGFIKKAGTIIFAASVFVWFLQSFNTSFQMVGDIEESMLVAVGRFISPIFIPLGFGDWVSSVALFTGALAKETVVATLGIIKGLGDVGEDNANLITSIQLMYTPLKAYSFMVFVLLAAPCFAAVAAMKREFNSWKLTFMAVAYQTIIAWVAATLIYQIGSLFI